MPKERFKITPASYLVLMKDNKVLLIRRFNTGYEDGNYSMVAGHLDGQETFIQAIIREAKEEADIDLDEKDLEVAHIMHRYSNSGDIGTRERIDVFIVAKKWAGEPKNMEPNKCDDLNWFPFDQLPDNTIPYIKFALDSIKNKVFYSEYGFGK